MPAPKTTVLNQRLAQMEQHLDLLKDDIKQIEQEIKKDP